MVIPVGFLAAFSTAESLHEINWGCWQCSDAFLSCWGTLASMEQGCGQKMLPKGGFNNHFCWKEFRAMHRTGIKEAIGNIRFAQEGILSLVCVLIWYSRRDNTVLWVWLFSIIFSISLVKFPRMLKWNRDKWKKNQVKVSFCQSGNKCRYVVSNS